MCSTLGLHVVYMHWKLLSACNGDRTFTSWRRMAGGCLNGRDYHSKNIFSAMFYIYVCWNSVEIYLEMKAESLKKFHCNLVS